MSGSNGPSMRTRRPAPRNALRPDWVVRVNRPDDPAWRERRRAMLQDLLTTSESDGSREEHDTERASSPPEHGTEHGTEHTEPLEHDTEHAADDNEQGQPQGDSEVPPQDKSADEQDHQRVDGAPRADGVEAVQDDDQAGPSKPRPSAARPGVTIACSAGTARRTADAKEAAAAAEAADNEVAGAEVGEHGAHSAATAGVRRV